MKAFGETNFFGKARKLNAAQRFVKARGMHTLDSALEVARLKRRQAVIAIGAPEDKTPRRLHNRFDIGWSHARCFLDQLRKRYGAGSAGQQLAKQPLAIGWARHGDLDLFAEAAAASDARVEPIGMIRGADQQHLMRRFDPADFNQRLLDKLRV